MVLLHCLISFTIRSQDQNTSDLDLASGKSILSVAVSRQMPCEPKSFFCGGVLIGVSFMFLSDVPVGCCISVFRFLLLVSPGVSMSCILVSLFVCGELWVVSCAMAHKAIDERVKR